MAAYKLEFKGLTHILVEQELNGTLFHCIEHKGSPKIQNGGLQTGSKPEVIMYQLVDKIRTRL